MAEETKASVLENIMAWPMPRKLSLAAVALISIVVFALIIIQARVADYQLLYANLSPTDASSVVNWLKDQKIPYELASEGKAVKIPADRVYEARLELAGMGLPQGGGVGFEVFDKQAFGLTDFAQKINYLRALQGELARTISSLAVVENARVHLALPEDHLFKEQQKQATASVILKIAPGQQLKEGQVQGIVHLVAGSIEGLDANNVTVVDSSGKILSESRKEEAESVVAPGMLEYQHTLEQRLENRAQSLLDTALGSGNSVVRVTAELNFLQQEQTEEKYDPEGSVVRSEQTSEEKSGIARSGGVPGSASNLPGGSGTMTSSSNPSSRSEETVNYEVSKVISKKVFPVGTIQNLSVAVLVADKVNSTADGKKPVAVPRSEEELASIQTMVSRALGLDDKRGDQIEVTSMPFENVFDTPLLGEPEKISNIQQYLPYVKYVLLLIAGALGYFLLLRPLVNTMREAKVVTQMKTVNQLEAEMAGQMALPESTQDPLNRVRDSVLKENGASAQVIKSWLKEG